LLYRHTPQQDRYKLKVNTDHLSLDRTYELINKWLELGLIEKKTILHGDKAWIWLSRQGLRTTRLSFQYGDGAPASVRLSHLYAINQVRLAIETKRPDDLWKSELQIRREASAAAKGEILPHTPDALLTNMETGKVTAIEVETHAKTDEELLGDLGELAVTYKSVWFFTTAATCKQIEVKLSTFPPEMQKPFVLYDVKDYGDDYGI
jgi:hypothetical protein